MRQTLSLKVYQDIYDKIRSHFYRPGDQLPTESELAEKYGVSLAPVRQALGKLESEHLILRMPGKGTFVAPVLPPESMVNMSGFSAYFINKKVDDESVQCMMIDSGRKKMTPEQAAVFKTDTKREFTFLSRVRYVDGKPLFFLNHYVEKIDPETVQAEGEIKSLRAFLAKHGMHSAYVQERVKAVAADEALGKLFSVPAGFPLLKIIRREFNEAYEPIVYGEYYVNSDVWDYRVQYNAKEF